MPVVINLTPETTEFNLSEVAPGKWDVIYGEFIPEKRMLNGDEALMLRSVN